MDTSRASHRNTMRVVMRRAFDVALEEHAVNSPRPQEIVLATQCSLISPGTELTFYTGTHNLLGDPTNTWAKYPFRPGYACAGVVTETGSEVTDFRAGDRIYAIAPHAGQHCLSPASQLCLPVPDGLALEHAVFARLTAIAMTALLVSEFDASGTVGVIGLGLIGNFAAQLFAQRCARVAAVDTVEQRVRWARQCDIDAQQCAEPAAMLKEMLGSAPDIVIEATGVPALAGVALDAVRERGQVVLLGSPRGLAELDIYRHIHSRGVRLTGAHERLQGTHGLPDRADNTRKVLEMIASDKIKVAPLLTHRLPASRAGEAYDMLLNHKEKALGIVLEWEATPSAET